MALKRNRSRKSNAWVGPKLAYELFSELNATSYEDDPSECLLVKTEAVTLMLAPAAALTPAYGSERVVGASRRVGTPVPSKEARDRYVRTECVLVLHHACETLLRLFFAHSEKPDCPWLGIHTSVFCCCWPSRHVGHHCRRRRGAFPCRTTHTHQATL